MAKLLGIDLGLLSIPLQRKTQTFAVMIAIGGFFLFGPACIVLTMYLLSTRFWWVTFGYSAWYVIDQHKVDTGGRKHMLWLGKWIRNWKLWECFRDYFPIKLVKTCDLDPSQNYILGYHPHGVLSLGAFSTFATDAVGFSQTFSGIKSHFMTLRCWFFIPFLRELLLLVGMSAASKTNLDCVLGDGGPAKRGRCVVMVIGGAAEAIYANPGLHTLVLSTRFGFIKKAILHGASLVPVYGFGESDLFIRKLGKEGTIFRGIQNRLRKILTFSTPVFHGRGICNYTFGFLPKRTPLSVVVGKPIPVVQNPIPNAEDVLEVHKQYCEALTNLFEENKGNYGVPKDIHLDIL